MKIKQVITCVTALSLAVGVSVASAQTDSTNSTMAKPLTGKEKATAIGAGSGAVAGAVVGGPIGAVVGAGIGGVVGHEGTDAHGHVTTAKAGDSKVRSAQEALNEKGYNVGAVDGRLGPNTQTAIRSFQSKNGLAETGSLDSATLNALGVNS
jgi:phage tail tape-measure protein